MKEIKQQTAALQLSAWYLKLTYHEQQLESIFKKIRKATMNKWERWYAAHRRHLDRVQYQSVRKQIIKQFLKEDRRN